MLAFSSRVQFITAGKSQPQKAAGYMVSITKKEGVMDVGAQLPASPLYSQGSQSRDGATRKGHVFLPQLSQSR